MALSGTDRGTGTKASSGTTVTLSPNANCTAGALVVLCFATDNSHAAGAAFTTFTCTDNVGAGNTWTRRQTPLYDPGAASAGVTGAIFTTPQDAGQILSTTTITVTVDTATTASAWALHEVTATGTVTYVTGGVNAGAGTASPTVTTGSILNGHMVIAAAFAENTNSGADLWVDDSDTLNGSWSTGQHTGVTASTSGMAISSQRKIITADGAQTYNPTSSAGTPDSILSWIELREDVSVNAGVAAGTGAAYNASETVASSAGNAAGTSAAQNASKSIAVSALEAVGSVPFPHDATTITDDFNRANESPIASPWDTTTWFDHWALPKADLVSNKWSVSSSYEGGAYWGTSQSGDFEAIVEIGSLSGLSDSVLEVGADATDGSVLDAIVFGSFSIGDQIYFSTVGWPNTLVPVTLSAGDLLGLRRVGSFIEFWRQPSGGSWAIVGRLPYSGPASVLVYLYGNAVADSVLLTEDNFRIAAYTGALIPVAVAYDATVTIEQGTSANAEAATGTGAAGNAQVFLAPTAEAASGTGAAYDATILVEHFAAAEAATGTGAAYDLSADIQASGTLAAGTGTASDASDFVDSNAEAATGTGAAGDIAAAVSGSAGIASGTAQSGDPAAALAANAEAGSGSGLAFDATVETTIVATAELAAGTGLAPDAQVFLAANAESSAGTGSAYDATVDTTTNVSANAGVAAGTGAAGQPSLALASSAEQAAGSGAAWAAVSAVAVQPGASAGTGSAFDATVQTSGGQVSANAEAALAIGQAFNATIVTTGVPAAHRRPSGAMIVTGLAPVPPPQTFARAGVARGRGEAYDAVLEVNDDDVALLLLLE